MIESYVSQSRKTSFAAIGAIVAVGVFTLPGCSSTPVNCTAEQNTVWKPAGVVNGSYLAERLREEVNVGFTYDQLVNGKVGIANCAGGFDAVELDADPVVRIAKVPQELGNFCVVIGMAPSAVESTKVTDVKVQCPAL